MISQLLRSGIPVWLSGALWFGVSHKALIKTLAGLWSHLKAPLGRNLILSSLVSLFQDYWPEAAMNSLPVGLSLWQVPTKLLVSSEGASEKNYEQQDRSHGFVWPDPRSGTPSLSPSSVHEPWGTRFTHTRGRGGRHRGMETRKLGSLESCIQLHGTHEMKSRGGGGAFWTPGREAWQVSFEHSKGKTSLVVVLVMMGIGNRGNGREHLTLKTRSLAETYFLPYNSIFFYFGELFLTHQFITLKSTYYKAITQDMLNIVDIYLALHKFFIVS